ncbi:slipin family protein [Pelotomaculum propionicicum]|uniref:Modulator of FtsH protease HflK n=1 Tax=Pelotomaculum propionicicum TaxID=258475 RepID=A0A4Y7RQC3_9FIRM|nr:slipin family protein [Pelotomaculum propionicicum]TEB11043.1 Modulator of FtsH protease HflK [Pelotomaculum propionicicum]
MLDFLSSSSLFLFLLLVLIIIALPTSLRVINQYQRAVLLRFGRFIKVLEPGLRFILPFGIDRTLYVDLRVATIDVSGQDIITKDNVPVSINAVVYFQVSNPEMAVLNVENFRQATTLLAQTLLRSVLGSHELDDMLSEREKLSKVLKEELDKSTESWGVRVVTVEIKSVDLPEGMKRAMAKQAEAERERRAKVISAEGEYQASQRIFEAASVISQNSSGLMLRMLQTLTEISVEKNSTIIFPLPMEIMEFFKGRAEHK